MGKWKPEQCLLADEGDAVSVWEIGTEYRKFRCTHYNLLSLFRDYSECTGKLVGFIGLPASISGALCSIGLMIFFFYLFK